MKSRMLLLIVLVVVLLIGCSAISEATSDPSTADVTATKTVTHEVSTLSETKISEPETSIPGPTATEAETSQQNDSNPWKGLSFDQFLEESWFSVMRRDPELLTELGLSESFGIGDDQLTNISREYRLKTYVLYEQILEVLYGYDRATLPHEQQLNYDIYAYYLEDMLRGQEFMDYEYPITHFVTGAQNQLINFFTDIHPVTDLQSAQDYVARLSQVNTKFEQVIANMQHSEQAGVITPRMILQWSLGDIQKIAKSPAIATPFYTSFSEKVLALDSLSSDEKATLLADTEAEIEASVIPAFRALATYLEDLQKRAPTEEGVWQYPGGEAYYDYAVAHFTTTELTPEEIHQLGLAELDRIQAEMRTIFDQLGYPSGEGLPALYTRVAQDGGTLYGEDVVAGYEAIIEDAKVRAGEVLGVQPQADVIVIPGPTGGYYIGPAVDGSRPGAFYAAVSGSEPKFGMPTLAYHEAVPGHHTQIALALEMDLPSFRRGSHFTAYVEGWALYAEALMAEIGVYTDNPYGDLGRLQFEAFRAARLVVDTGIHAKGWTFDQAQEFMLENTGLPRGQVQFEITRYIAWPGQALAYKIGMNEIMRLRSLVQSQLGDQFDIRAFHNVVLGNGAVPLSILEQIVEDYIATTQSGF
jgi:uncharacterized protein (DUF885 family)